MPNIKLQSSDGETFEIDIEIAKQSVIIKTMLEGMYRNFSSKVRVDIARFSEFICIIDLGMDDDEEEAVPLPNVNSAILKKVCISLKSSEIDHYKLKSYFLGDSVVHVPQGRPTTARRRRKQRETH